MILSAEQVSLQALALMQGHLAERSAVCAKVIDRDGKVVGVNRRGLEMLSVESGDICGKVWVDFWEGRDFDTEQDAEEDLPHLELRRQRWVGHLPHEATK